MHFVTLFIKPISKCLNNKRVIRQDSASLFPVCSKNNRVRSIGTQFQNWRSNKCDKFVKEY